MGRSCRVTATLGWRGRAAQEAMAPAPRLRPRRAILRQQAQKKRHKHVFPQSAWRAAVWARVAGSIVAVARFGRGPRSLPRRVPASPRRSHRTLLATVFQSCSSSRGSGCCGDGARSARLATRLPARPAIPGTGTRPETGALPSTCRAKSGAGSTSRRGARYSATQRRRRVATLPRPRRGRRARAPGKYPMLAPAFRRGRWRKARPRRRSARAMRWWSRGRRRRWRRQWPRMGPARARVRGPCCTFRPIPPRVRRECRGLRRSRPVGCQALAPSWAPAPGCTACPAAAPTAC